MLATALAQAGDEIHVWAPEIPAAAPSKDRAIVHRLPGHFGPLALARLSRELKPDGRMLVQYVPHAYGLKAMNLGFTAWLWAQRDRMPIDVMFHEVSFPITRGQPPRHSLLGAVTRLMALMVARSASRIFVATPAWEPLLRRLVGPARKIEWLPIPSNIPVVADRSARARVRERYLGAGRYLVGHFGTYGDGIVKQLGRTLSILLRERSDTAVLLIGSRSIQFRDSFVSDNGELGARIGATGALEATAVSANIAACDLMVQPYPDGATTRRTSLMAALAHGIATVTTTGALTETIWNESGAVALACAGDEPALATAAAQLLDDVCARSHLALAGHRLYVSRFDLRHTIDALMSDDDR